VTKIAYPRVFEDASLSRIAFPLGGVGAGCISLGGRGQLRDWEIFNRPDKGRGPLYAFASLWAQDGSGSTQARVLEGRLRPPYDGPLGLGSRNAPGLRRMSEARFESEFPIALVRLEDPDVPVRRELQAYGTFVPHEADLAGLPVAVLRYRIGNRTGTPVTTAVAFSLENPIGAPDLQAFERNRSDGRINLVRSADGSEGLLMSNTELAAGQSPEAGTIALAYLPIADEHVTVVPGWPRGNWWDAPEAFWEAFSTRGELPGDVRPRAPIGSICAHAELPAGGTRTFTFLIAWHFPNRTPAHCGWRAPSGHEHDVIGNWYATAFDDAWGVVDEVRHRLPHIDGAQQRFLDAVRESTIPAVVKDAAVASLSTLVTPTCFRTADGEFHGFEGTFEQSGSCYGSCTHVWNYETATHQLFPTLARSLRRAAFGYSLDDQGAMRARELLPSGIERFEFAAADGQTGQIVKAYYDWQLSGDDDWLRKLWPHIRRALEFCWLPGSWDADADGVMEGVQHSTYDVELCGPNPQCQTLYLAALRAGEEIARHLDDTEFATRLRGLFLNGRAWTDAQLFNGEYYVQRVRPRVREKVIATLVGPMGASDLSDPDYQIGAGCLVDQLVGQYLADVAGLGPLLDMDRIRLACRAIFTRNLADPVGECDTLARTFALNDEAGLRVCAYPPGERPRRPLPVSGEVMSGFEYSAAAVMLAHGLADEGLTCIENIRRRYDGERRNPWDEAECGHHYARAMAAWSAFVILGAFRYSAPELHVDVGAGGGPPLRAFWSTGTGWGRWSHQGDAVRVETLHGRLVVRSITLPLAASRIAVTVNDGEIPVDAVETAEHARVRVRLAEPVVLGSEQRLQLCPR
jgi:non-lysosomal glucosylceramidase